MIDRPSLHATAVLAGARAVLIRGPSGSGKSQLALALLQSAPSPILAFARLVGDDRVRVEPAHGRLLVRPAEPVSGLIEIRGLGIRPEDHERVAVVGLVVDLANPDAERMPRLNQTTVDGIGLPWLAVPPGADALRVVLTALNGRHFQRNPAF